MSGVRLRGRTACASLSLLALVMLPCRIHAQSGAASTPAEPEVRVDLIAGNRPAIQAGAGVQIPLGYYVRLGADAAVGMRTGQLDGSRVDGRVDLLARFLLDPFRQTAYGVSGGAGLSARVEPGERVTPLLLVALEVEGRRSPRGWVPALQLGLGGGARVGLILRRADAAAR